MECEVQVVDREREPFTSKSEHHSTDTISCLQKSTEGVEYGDRSRARKSMKKFFVAAAAYAKIEGVNRSALAWERKFSSKCRHELLTRPITRLFGACLHERGKV